MIISFFNRQFNRFNIDNRKTRVYIPSLFMGYLVLKIALSLFLTKIFPQEDELVLVKENNKELNLISLTLFLVFGAIMEEFKYRGLLTKFNYKWVLISLSVFITTIIFVIFNIKVYYLYPESLLPMIGYFIFFIITGIIIYFTLFKLLFKHKEKIKNKFDSNFNLILLTQVGLFAIWHILFSGQGNEAHYINLFIFHSVGALFYSFIRINYGILYSIIVHFFYNFLVTVVPVILVRLVS
ncbi:hypothetical protein [Aquimarina algiphila]|uniref:hypothetical protein n=1 Tax=Aquimarina algiphila TaxID=2047982 RepID=UPI0024900C30|nr:hypothetical protein [Aquimarina algiphila]